MFLRNGSMSCAHPRNTEKPSARRSGWNTPCVRAATRGHGIATNRSLLGFDEHGQVFDLGHVIHRRVRAEYQDRVAKLYGIYKSHGLAAKGIVDTMLREDGDLEHRKLVISYPFEWPARMYKDAVLFHLGLFLELETAGLTLK